MVDLIILLLSVVAVVAFAEYLKSKIIVSRLMEDREHTRRSLEAFDLLKEEVLYRQKLEDSLYDNSTRKTEWIPYEEYRDYLKSDKWKFIRSVRFNLDDGLCQHCGIGLNDTEAHCHHLTYARLGDEDISDVVTLCRSCHDAVHAKDKSTQTEMTDFNRDI
jgi:5-methylcytosine-specific restriction endonuclease McrA